MLKISVTLQTSLGLGGAHAVLESKI